MAAASGKRASSSKKRSGNTNTATIRISIKKKNTYQKAQDSALFHEIGLIVLFVAMVVLFCCNFGVIGPVGDSVSAVMLGFLAGRLMRLRFFFFWLWRFGRPMKGIPLHCAR